MLTSVPFMYVTLVVNLLNQRVPLVPGSTPEAVERVSHGEVSLLGETLEDMSLSSTSSLERHNDTSQEYMDDFDNLGMF